MTNQQKWILGVIAVVVVVGIISWGSSRDQVAPATGESIKIGAIFLLETLI